MAKLKLVKVKLDERGSLTLTRFANGFANLGCFPEFGAFFPGKKQGEFIKIGAVREFGGFL